MQKLGERSGLRVGVIGCGAWGSNHARTLASLGVLAAVADRNPDRSGALHAQFGCVQADPLGLIRNLDLDAIVLAVPPEDQPPLALQVIAAGRHVFLEKPIALDLATAARIEAEASAAGIVAMTGHLMLYHPALEAIAGLIGQGALGELRQISSRRAGFGRFFQRCDVSMDLLLHDLTVLTHLFGPLPAMGHWQGRAVLSEMADVGELTMTLESGVGVQCGVSRVSPVRERRMIFSGSHATAVFDDLRDWPDKLVIHAHPEGSETAQPLVVTPVDLPVMLPLEAELRHFLHCIHTGQAPRSHLAQAREVLRFILSLRQDKVAGLPIQDTPVVLDQIKGVS